VAKDVGRSFHLMLAVLLSITAHGYNGDLEGVGNMSVQVMKRALAVSMCLGTLSLAVSPSIAQDTEGLGTIVAPLQPNRKVGLPNQAPANEQSAPATAEGAKPAKPGQPQAAAPEAKSQPSETDFGDWKMECVDAASAAVPCQVIYRGLSPDQKQVVMVISLAYAKSAKETKIQMALPLGFAVQPGVTIDLGNGYAGLVQVSRCTAQGCLVDGAAAPEMIDAMEKGKAGKIAIKTVEGATINLPFSLGGFSDAFEAMKKKNEAAPS
jgi:invasion protein IalB